MFKEFITEFTNTKEIAQAIKTLKKYDATILNKSSISEQDVIDWAKGSIMYASEYAQDFDMSPNEFEKFARYVDKNSEAIAKKLK